MVVRTIEMKKITFHVPRAKHQKIKDKISITGDFSNYKKETKLYMYRAVVKLERMYRAIQVSSDRKSEMTVPFVDTQRNNVKLSFVRRKW
ncbi:MAG: hypothetical protein AB1485_02685 [Candidatus Thermoplasmatota archaeon]